MTGWKTGNAIQRSYLRQAVEEECKVIHPNSLWNCVDIRWSITVCMHDIILVTGKDDVSYCRKEIVEACDFRKVRAVIPGGKERYLSVYEGLKAAAGTDYVLIHDGARPMIDEMEIRLSMHV